MYSGTPLVFRSLGQRVRVGQGMIRLGARQRERDWPPGGAGALPADDAADDAALKQSKTYFPLRRAVDYWTGQEIALIDRRNATPSSHARAGRGIGAVAARRSRSRSPVCAPRVERHTRCPPVGAPHAGRTGVSRWRGNCCTTF